jgi:hypothetical protein
VRCAAWSIAARPHAEGAALVDLHQGTIGKAHSGARVGGGSQLLALVQCSTRCDGTVHVIGDQIGCAIDGLNFRTNTRRYLPVCAIEKNGGEDSHTGEG